MVKKIFFTRIERAAKPQAWRCYSRTNITSQAINTVGEQVHVQKDLQLLGSGFFLSLVQKDFLVFGDISR